MPEYLKLEPGQPLPEGVEADAPRYVAMERPSIPPAGRAVAGWGAGAAAAASVALFGLGMPQPGILALTAATVLALPAWFGRGMHRTMRLSRDGNWVELPVKAPAEDKVPLLLLSPREYRILGAVLYLVLAVAAYLLAGWEGAGATILILAGMYARDLAGRWSEQSPTEVPGSESFRALANPRRPLPAPGSQAAPSIVSPAEPPPG